jgi:hypothetical protein
MTSLLEESACSVFDVRPYAMITEMNAVVKVVATLWVYNRVAVFIRVHNVMEVVWQVWS